MHCCHADTAKWALLQIRRMSICWIKGNAGRNKLADVLGRKSHSIQYENVCFEPKISFNIMKKHYFE
jgi:hypothetical protein